MQKIRTVSRHVIGVICDEHGGEVIEYALIMGLIVVVTISVIGSFGTKVLARWSSANSSM